MGPAPPDDGAPQKARGAPRSPAVLGARLLALCVLSPLLLAGALAALGGSDRRDHASGLHALFRSSGLQVLRAGVSEARPCGLVYRLRSESALRSLGVFSSENALLATVFGRLAGGGCGREAPCEGAAERMDELLRGAHVLVEGDGAWWYRHLREAPGSYRRRSSHASSAAQYGVYLGPTLKTVLAGVVPGTGDSWLQFEGANWAPLRYPVDSLLHAVYYLQYLVRGYQVGPLGTSLHTERNPVTVPFDGCVTLAHAANASLSL